MAKKKTQKKSPDVMVTIEGGVASVDVYTPGVVVEVRDFDVEGCDEPEKLFTNEEGDKCYRYKVKG